LLARSLSRTRCLVANCITAVFIPITFPALFAKGPPLLPGLMVASVCMSYYELLPERDLRLNRSIERTDDSYSDGRPADETEWRAHYNSRLPDPDLSALCHLRHWQILIIDVNDRDVRLRAMPRTCVALQNV
jgi:hypothetical protein